MRKKLIAIALIIGNFLVNNVYAEKLSHKENANGEIVITAQGFGQNSMLAMTVYSEITSGGNVQKYIKQIDEKQADSSGNAEFKFDFFETDPSATYTVSIQDETMADESVTLEIDFVNELAINLVNKAEDANGLLDVLKNYGMALNIDSKMLEDTDEAKVAQKLFTEKSIYDKDNFEDFQKLYFETAALTMVKESEGAELQAVFEKYSCGVDVSEKSDYNKLSDNAKLSLCGKIAGKEYKSLSSLQEAWKEQTGFTIIEKVKYPALYTWITNGESVGLTEDYEKLLGLDSNSTYSKLIDKKAPYQSIAGKSYSDKETLYKAFASACETQYKKENPTSGNGTGGSGGSGGGGGGIPSVAVNTKDSSSQNTTENSTANGTGYYSDISDFAWAEEAINSLTGKNVLAGTGNGLFRPEQEVTREEFLKMLVVALDLPIIESEKSFSDVSDDAWYKKYVSTGIEVGLVNGISDELFGSGKPITRADMAVMIERASKLTGTELKAVSELIEFADNENIPEYAKSSVEKVQMSGIINGYTDKTFKPAQTATRAESAVVIYKLLGLK